MGILLWILFGGLVGLAASLLTGSGGGLIKDIIIGIVGAVIGGWIMSLISKTGITGFNIYSFLVALLGAVILILVVKAITK
jgi:uncharacterized membrane protein YeaQ/YmgE (transglycosylase-associated protein family)